MNRILLIGIEPTLVGFSSMPDLDAAKVSQGLRAQEQRLRDLGFDAAWCLTDLGATAEEVVRAALAAKPYDVVLIGAGIRVMPANFSLFERLINIVHEGAPQAKICFNTGPGDTQKAVLRWIAPPRPGGAGARGGGR
jgi:NADPH:quinone reductase-like Zn-dependent oxidoreductase